MYQALSKEYIIAEGCLDIDNFETVVDRYFGVLLTGTAEAMEAFLSQALQVNHEAAYADFYYPVLKAEEQQRFIGMLTETQKEMADQFRADGQNVYFRLDQKNLPFLAAVTARELLFSTFYFAREKAVVWGNYELKYPLFCEEEETLKRYIQLAEQNGLTKEWL